MLHKLKAYLRGRKIQQEVKQLECTRTQAIQTLKQIQKEG